MHTCHAINCKKQVPPAMFMCKPHWFRVPKLLRDEIWRTYRPGQERDKKPSKEYCQVAQIAVRAVAESEGIKIKGTEPEWLLFSIYKPKKLLDKVKCEVCEVFEINDGVQYTNLKKLAQHIKDTHAVSILVAPKMARQMFEGNFKFKIEPPKRRKDDSNTRTKTNRKRNKDR